MKKRSSVFPLALVALLVCGTISGCAPAAPSGDGTASAKEVSQAMSQKQTDGAEEKPVLKQLMMNTSEGDYNTYPVAKDIAEMTGYKVQYDMLPQDAPMDKLNLIMASGEEYDMIVTGGDVARVMDYAKNGALMDLEPYMAEAPEIARSISPYERETFSLDGALYALGMEALSFDGLGEVRELMFTRQDWLDALNLKTPTTTDEFVAVLEAFKNYDNGSGNKIIPMTLNGAGVGGGGLKVEGLIGAFGIPNEWNELDGKLVYRGADPRMKDFLAFMKTLYQKGLLDAEFPANKSENQKEKFSTGIAGVAPFGYWDVPSLSDTMAETQPGFKLAYLPPLKGPKGDVGIGTGIGGFDRICFVPKTTKHISDVINFMNIALEEENFRTICIGKEGVHFTFDADTGYSPIKPIFFEERNLAVNYTTGRQDTYPEYWMCRAQKDDRQFDCWKYMNKSEDIKALNVLNVASKAPAFPETSKNKQALDQMLFDQHIKIIAGSDTVDSYDAFLKEWMAAGGEAMTKEYNEWWVTR